MHEQGRQPLLRLLAAWFGMWQGSVGQLLMLQHWAATLECERLDAVLSVCIPGWLYVALLETFMTVSLAVLP